MVKLGYLKDSLALPFFLFGIYKIYNLNKENIILTKNEILIYLFIAFITDLSFTFIESFHNTDLGNNLYSYYFVLMILLVLINFLYFNNKLLV